ncbi:hypothetical protein [Tenacibaculum agarivorans]|uniref:hypothetical protein n=1 Tax=Tenacibaculum agarivorans TaxID=1908389 RepID=UPI00094B881A|nr:hypothetical protein [Tenacibaculum agarivorans]
MNTLQKSLLANAIFSGLSGIILTVAHVKIATLFNLKNTTVFWVIGVVLLYFTGTIVYEIKKQRKIAVQWIILQDFLWVLGSGIILIFTPFQISTIGNRLIGFIALIVLFMGLNQLSALKKTCKL